MRYKFLYYTREMLASLVFISMVWVTKLLFWGRFHNERDTFSRTVGALYVRSKWEIFSKDQFYLPRLITYSNGPSIKIFVLRLLSYVVSGTPFRALRAYDALNFFMDQFHLPRRFQRGIARPNLFMHFHFYLVSVSHFRVRRACGV